jgi:hypothetical protein
VVRAAVTPIMPRASDVHHRLLTHHIDPYRSPAHRSKINVRSLVHVEDLRLPVFSQCTAQNLAAQQLTLTTVSIGSGSVHRSIGLRVARAGHVAERVAHPFAVSRPAGPQELSLAAEPARNCLTDSTKFWRREGFGPGASASQISKLLQ